MLKIPKVAYITACVINQPEVLVPSEAIVNAKSLTEQTHSGVREDNEPMRRYSVAERASDNNAFAIFATLW